MDKMLTWLVSWFERPSLVVVEKKLANNKYDYAAWKIKVHILLSSDRIPEAISALISAAKYVPDEEYLQDVLFKICFMLGRFKEAVRHMYSAHICHAKLFRNPMHVYHHIACVILNYDHKTNCRRCTRNFSLRLSHFRKNTKIVPKVPYLSLRNSKYENFVIASILVKRQLHSKVEDFCMAYPSLIFLPLIPKERRSVVFRGEIIYSKLERITREVLEFGFGYYYTGNMKRAFDVMRFGLRMFDMALVQEKSVQRSFIKYSRVALLYHRADIFFRYQATEQALADLAEARSIEGYLYACDPRIRLRIEAYVFGRAMKSQIATCDMSFLL
jgi:tetratricopeptide (TPR) repeat protein